MKHEKRAFLHEHTIAMCMRANCAATTSQCYHFIHIEKYHVEEMHICARVHAVHQLYTIEILFQWWKHVIKMLLVFRAQFKKKMLARAMFFAIPNKNRLKITFIWFYLFNWKIIRNELKEKKRAINYQREKMNH